MSVRAAADKRFRRARVRPVRRRRWRAIVNRRVVTIVAGTALAIVAGYRATALVTGSSLFRVTRVVVRGNARLSTGEVLATVSGLRDRSILTANLARERARLLESSWVAEASLRRRLPSTVEITLVERTPIGLCRIGSRLYLVDGEGAIIDEHGPHYADLDLPIIDGLASGPRGGQPLVDEVRAALAARLLASVAAYPELARRVSQIDVRDAHDAVVMLEGDAALIHVGDGRFAERLQAYIELAPTLRTRVPEIDYVDVRFDERVYVRPAATSGRSRP
ncbi:MAG: cell division protein FtsQ/DivIB [Vicinamibacterales bacterium]